MGVCLVVLEDEGWPAAAIVGCHFVWDVTHDQVEWSRNQGAARHSTQEAFLAAVHPDDRSELTDAIRRSLADQAPFRCEVRITGAGERWISGRGEPCDDRVRGVLVDTSDDRRVQLAIAGRERAASRWARLYAALSQINQAILSTISEDELFVKVCGALGEHGGFRMTWIGKYDAVSRAIVPVASWGDDSAYLRAIRISAEDIAEGRGPTGTAFREGRRYVSDDLLLDAKSLPWRDQLLPRGFRSSAVFPIREGGAVCGTLSVYADDVGFFGAKEIALLEEASLNLSFALDNFARERIRRDAVATLRRERDFSEAVLRSLPGVLYLYDEHRRFLRWNANFERMTGYTTDEIRELDPLAAISSSTREAVRAGIEQVFGTGAAAVDAELLARDGTTTPYHFTGVKTIIDGRPCLIGVGIDLSVQREAERAVRDLNQNLELRIATRTRELHEAMIRAEAADRLKSAFLATMSHELRTPLNSIIGFTGILQQGMAGPVTAEQYKQLGMVRTSARHLLELINDVLDISKIEADQLQIQAARFDLAESLGRAVTAVAPLAAAKGLHLETRVDPAVGAIVSDRRRVEQILLNLINNAIKFTDTGRVTITCDRVESGEPAYRVRVIDTGIGIKAEDLSTLFQPFRQIDTGLARRHEGTGLGLAICRRLATLLGGEITVTSTWGQGSEFTLTIPVGEK